MPKLTLISGARDFLRDVFAQQARRQEFIVRSFILVRPETEPGKRREERARHLFETRHKAN